MAQIHPLRAFRERHDPPLSRTQLAKYLGVTPAAVWRWEAGMRQPTGDSLRLIVRKTGISGRDLRPDLAKLMG